ncbi:polysaccharide biosynthesis tyrosine autokinase [Serratia fonticola]|uniref:polysaccharide biosynthesis tyrosine autokinase n=1 Tax=Serratia fonticola TaxID=47917 RepID=UPI00192B8E6A|nr:polysaccharide biosynthesis tyrosine autokinase [Serratia fonticola]MBL5902089.1 polysaccharide biosynthesis tyrosine autokinase [Serratia fonticola]
MKDKLSVQLAPESEGELDIGRLVGTLIDYRWLIAGVTSFFAVIGVIFVLFSTPIYKAEALVQVEQNAGTSLLNNISQILPNSQSPSAPEIEIIKSRMVIGKTIDELNLTTIVKQRHLPLIGDGIARIMKEKKSVLDISKFIVPEILFNEKIVLETIGKREYEISFPDGTVLQGEVGKLLSKDGISILVNDMDANIGDSFTIIKESELEVRDDILKLLSIEDAGKDTGVLSLTFLGSDPILIKKILRSITDNYLQQNIERKSEEAGKSLAFLTDQLPKVKTALLESERRLNNFRQKNDSVDLTLEAKSVLDTMVAVDSQLNELTFKEAEISKLYTKEHPAYRALMEKRDTLEKEKDKLNQKVNSMPKTQQEILSLTRDVQSGQEVYMQLLSKQQELSINKASTIGNVRIIDNAVTFPEPVKPQKALLILLFIFLGLVLSCIIVIFKALFHKGIESPEQLEERGINVYASIPLSQWQVDADKKLIKSNGRKSNTRSNKLLSIGNPTDIAVEAIRSLRTTLHFAMIDATNNTLMISGTSPAIGKTFVTANLAVVIAQTGQKVLIIDSDMRKGYLHDIFNENNEIGLSDVLSNKVSYEDVVKKTTVDNLYFVPRGMIAPNPSELLMSERFRQFIEWANKNYAIVLIDTPPILAVTDAAIVGRIAGTSLLVAKASGNTIKEVEVSYRRFEQNGIEIKGAILNAVVRKASVEYGYGYYQYEYTNKE